MSYSTYLGGSGADGGNGIAVDATGAVYVIGTTSSTDFPTVNAVQPALSDSGSADLFVAKLTPDGTALVYATYLGGSDSEYEADIAVDSAGAAYISALTFSTDFPTVNAFQPANSGNQDTVVVKLSADGSRLIYSTYLGGSGEEFSGAIAVDLAGAAYVAGWTVSADFPRVNAPQAPPSGLSDAYVAKLAPDGSALLYSIFLGGTRDEAALDIVVDSLGDAYVTGFTTSADFPLVNPFQAAYGGGFDAFVAKLVQDGTRLIYSTYLGGTELDQGHGIAVDASGAAYVTGYTKSSDFPTMNALQPQLAVIGDRDAFVVKIAPEGGAMIYGTYLGGSGLEVARGIAVDIAGAAHVTGDTFSDDFPTMNALQPASGGLSDAFVSKLSPDGASLVHSTYLGGRENDYGIGITVDLTGATYVTGGTRSKDFPTTTSLQARCSGGYSDAFVAKITDDSLASSPAGASLAGSATTQSISSSRGGGGAMDALFLVMLAQVAFAAALRRRSARPHRFTPPR